MGGAVLKETELEKDSSPLLMRQWAASSETFLAAPPLPTSSSHHLDHMDGGEVSASAGQAAASVTALVSSCYRKPAPATRQPAASQSGEQPLEGDTWII